MTNLLKKTFGFLGEKEEYQVIKALVEDQTFYDELHSQIDPEYFETPALKRIVEVMMDFQSRKNYCPSWRDITLLIREGNRTVEDQQLAEAALDQLQNNKDLDDGMTTAKEVGINCIKRLNIQRILENGKRACRNDYTVEKRDHIIEELRNIDKETRTDWASPLDMISRVASNKRNERQPTGIPEIDKQFKGGLPKQSVGLVVAGTGIGKTTFGSIMTAKSAALGKKVLHIYFEDTLEEICSKYYAALWEGHYTTDFENDWMDSLLRQHLDEDPVMKTALSNIKSLPLENAKLTIEQILDRIIQSIRRENFYPDIIVMDYLACIKKTEKMEYEAFERAMKLIAQFAKDYNVAFWVFQQNNAGGEKEETKNNSMANILGGPRVAHPASIALMLERNRNAEDAGDYKLMTIKTLKCRGCEPHTWRDIYLNNGTCHIDLTEHPLFEEDNVSFTQADY